ncbi:MAG TPA: hypothetical protein VIU15_34865, partial [Streptomyces sp.]
MLDAASEGTDGPTPRELAEVLWLAKQLTDVPAHLATPASSPDPVIPDAPNLSDPPPTPVPRPAQPDPAVTLPP